MQFYMDAYNFTCRLQCNCETNLRKERDGLAYSSFEFPVVVEESADLWREGERVCQSIGRSVRVELLADLLELGIVAHVFLLG